MRYHEFMMITEEPLENTLSGNLTKQADAKADQAKRLKQQAALAKKREQINGQRTNPTSQIERAIGRLPWWVSAPCPC